MRWTSALWWLLVPLTFFAYSLIRGAIVDWYPYPFIDVGLHGYGKVSVKAPGRTALIAKLNAWAQQISTGKVKPPRTGIANG